MLAPAILGALLTACGGGGGAGGSAPSTTPSSRPPQLYQPLAVGDSWKYTCHFRNPPGPGTFPIANAVTGMQTVNGVATFALELQIVTSPSKIATETMLVANDAAGNTTLYGYVMGGTVLPVSPAVIVAAAPSTTASYNYTGPNGVTVTRTFVSIGSTNPTPLGVFVVAIYYETGGTHNYGYALGQGIMEEDHGPNFQYDCVINAVHLS